MEHIQQPGLVRYTLTLFLAQQNTTSKKAKVGCTGPSVFNPPVRMAKQTRPTATAGRSFSKSGKGHDLRFPTHPTQDATRDLHCKLEISIWERFRQGEGESNKTCTDIVFRTSSVSQASADLKVAPPLCSCSCRAPGNSEESYSSTQRYTFFLSFSLHAIDV